MDGWDIEALSEEFKFQIKIEHRFFDFGYNNPWGFMYLYIYTHSPGFVILLQLIATLRLHVVFKDFLLDNKLIWTC